MIGRPSDAEFAPFYAGYVSRVPETDVLGVLSAQVDEVRWHARAFSARELFRYEPDNWSVREVFGHMTDAERVFGYRALCISRGDQTPLPGFDENSYVARSGFAGCALADLADEFGRLRESNLMMFRRLDGAAWRQQGLANGSPVSVRALAFIMAGHVRHHFHVLSTRYSGG